jgi:hypothetical protein
MRKRKKPEPVLDPEAAALVPGRQLEKGEILELPPGELVFRSINGGPAYLQRVGEQRQGQTWAYEWYHPERGWGTGRTTLTGNCKVFAAVRGEGT